MTPTSAENLLREVARCYWYNVEGEAVNATPLEAERGWEAVNALSNVPRAAGWLIVALAKEADTEGRRATLAAGPFEDLLESSDRDSWNIVEAELGTSKFLVDIIYRINDPSTEQARTWLEHRREQHPRPLL